MLEFPLHESFFPQVVLNAEEVRYYKRLGKERLNELIRIAEDAELAYKWTDIRTPKMNTTVQKTQFLDMRPATKATFASTLIKCSVVIPDTRPDEVLLAIARGKTKEYRKMMGHLHGSAFLDGRTLFKFPSSIAASRPEYSYRAIKWCALKGKSESNKLDFSFLEYAGKRKPTPGSMVVGFCLQESIQREREIPLLENFGFVRGYLSRSGIIVSKTHQPNVVRVTAICQIDGDIEPLVRTVLEGIMQDMVGSVVHMRGLLDRQRVSGMKFLEQWEWVANGDRKACAVCLKGFFFHRKHHCRACGEVVCSSCAPLRALDEPVYDIRELRICTSCMTKSGRMLAPESSNDRNNQNETLTSDNSSQSYNAGDSRGPKNSSLEERQFLENEIKDRMRRPSDAARLLLDNNNKGTPKSKRRLSTFLKNPRATVDTISNLVDQIREARDTINITISEAGESRLSFGEEDAYTDLYEEVSKLRDTVEFSADGPNQNPARPRRPSQLSAGGGGRYMPAPAPAPSKSMMRPTLEDAIWGADGHSGDEMHHTSLEYRLSDESVRDNYHSVLEKTFAAARANLAVGRAVLSSCASDHDARFDPHDDDDDLPSPSENSGYSSSDTNKDPYASANYDRVMTNLSGNNRDSLGAMYDDGFSNPSAAFVSQRQQQQMHPLRSSRVHVLEKKIEDLQRDLMNAQRKLSYFEPDPEYEGLGIVHEEAFDGEDSPFFRSNPRPMRRSSDFSRRGSAQAPPQTFPRTRQVPMKQRPQSDGLLKTDFPSRRSIDVGTLERQRGDFRQRRGSEFQARPSTAAATSRASLGGRAHSTAEMLTELFSVMNPGEMSKSAGPHRKGSMMRGLPSSHRARSASPSDTHRASSSQRSSLSRAPPPPPPSAVSMYIDDKGRILPGTPSSSLGSPKAGHGLDKTASSSASYASAFNESHSSTGSGRFRLSGGPRAHSPGYRDVLGPNPAYEDHDEISSSDSSDIFGGVVSNQREDSPDDSDDGDDDHDHSAAHDDAPVQPVRRESTFFGDLATTDVAFFGQTVVPTDGRPPQVPSRRASVLGGPPRPSMLARATSGRDESEELRDLMEGLGRPRSNSVPFRIHAAQAIEDPNARPTSDGASVSRQSSPFARDPRAPEQYERLPWSDDKYARRPPSSSTRSIQIGNPDRFERPDASPMGMQPPSQRGGARQLEGAVAQVRACLASLHTECPSQWERHRKLQSISKIMKSLQRDGSRSKFRSLSHEEFQYERVLEETPSIVQLLRLAGYVSQPQKLIMRNVNQEYIAVLLLEIEEELHEMQATQDYL